MMLNEAIGPEYFTGSGGGARDYNDIISAANKGEADTDTKMSRDLKMGLTAAERDFYLNNKPSVALLAFRKSFRKALEGLQSGTAHEVEKHLKAMAANRWVTGKLGARKKIQNGPYSEKDKKFVYTLNSLENKTRNLHRLMKQAYDDMEKSSPDPLRQFRDIPNDELDTDSGGSERLSGKKSAWDGFISRSSDKASARKIKSLWMKMAGKAGVHGNAKDKAAPGYQYYTKSYKDWQKWYKECQQDAYQMSMVGKDRGQNLNAKDVVTILNSFADSGSSDAITEHVLQRILRRSG